MITDIYNILFIGVHKLLKSAAWKQFGRLPYLTTEGKPYYIDLICWQANQSLRKTHCFQEFCKTLKDWIHNPDEEYRHFVPVHVEPVQEEAEEEEEEPEEEEPEE